MVKLICDQFKGKWKQQEVKRSYGMKSYEKDLSGYVNEELYSKINGLSFYEPIIAEYIQEFDDTVRRIDISESKYRDREYREQLYEQYSYLIYHLDKTAEKFFTFIQKMILRTFKERKKIARILNGRKDFGKLEDTKVFLESNQCIQEFQYLTIVYKDDDCVFDEGYQKVLETINDENLFRHKFRIRKICKSEDCSWMEYITQQGCNSKKSKRERFL